MERGLKELLVEGREMLVSFYQELWLLENSAFQSQGRQSGPNRFLRQKNTSPLGVQPEI